MFVFPTHVGVFLAFTPFHHSLIRLPHARGGVSSSAGFHPHPPRSSPRTWGCFRTRKKRQRQREVFPTHVGVFLVLPNHARAWISLPHARGGVSQTADTVGFRRLSSLRTWGISKKY